MASLSIPFSDFVAGTTIVSDQVDQNNAAIVNYINARNGATANWDAVSTVGAFTSTLTTNQIILGTTRTVTLTAPTPATLSRVITFPDLTGDYSVVGTIGTQSIAGAKTFTQTIAVTQSNSGSPVGTTISNTSNTASSDARHSMVVAGTSGGDAYLDMMITSGREWTFGVDNSDDDSIVLSKASVPGSNNAFRVDGTTSGVAIRGTNTNDSPTAGFVGEVITASITGNINAPTTGQWGDANSMSLTAGDWLVYAQYNLSANGATVTNVEIGISITSGNSSTGLVSGDSEGYCINPTASTNSHGVLAGYHLQLSATTTVYQKSKWSYSVATPRFEGLRLNAVRIR